MGWLGELGSGGWGWVSEGGVLCSLKSGPRGRPRKGLGPGSRSGWAQGDPEVVTMGIRISALGGPRGAGEGRIGGCQGRLGEVTGKPGECPRAGFPLCFGEGGSP